MIELKEVGELLEKIRKERPLIHNLTNTVVTNFTANGLLALGASPVMADARRKRPIWRRWPTGCSSI
ncbi:hypothetical protein CULT_870008 [[Clostridium] ultunense Esp]|nr:hypothetical protein CULT_870008 [[Clostridium] ultunense Esp]